MSEILIVTGINRSIKGNNIFELNLLGMYPTLELADERIKELRDIGDFDNFHISIFNVGTDGADLNLSLIP